MKKLLLLCLIVFFSACVTTQVKKVPNLVEIEGCELHPIEYFIDTTLEEVYKWEMVDEGKMDDDGLGMKKGTPYIYRVFKHPTDPSSVAMVIYITEPFERAERIGLMTNHPYYGPQLIAVLDRYKNSDSWYVWDHNKWQEQHPTPADPARFKRHDACVKIVEG